MAQPVATLAKFIPKKISRKIKGTEITRKTSQNSPAYCVEQSDGSAALKSHTELRKV